MMIFHAFNNAYDQGIGRKASIVYKAAKHRRKWSKIVALYSWSRESPNVRSRSFLNSASRRTKGPAFTSCPSSAGCNVTALDSIQDLNCEFQISKLSKLNFKYILEPLYNNLFTKNIFPVACLRNRFRKITQTYLLLILYCSEHSKVPCSPNNKTGRDHFYFSYKRCLLKLL